MGIFTFIAIQTILFRNRILNFRFTQEREQVGFKACFTLHLSNILFNFLSLTLFNIELAALEILFESKLTGRPIVSSPNSLR